MSAHLKHLLIAGLIAAVVLLVAWKVLAHQGNIAHDQRILAEEKLQNDLAVAKVQAAASAAAGADLQAKLDAQTAATVRLQADLVKLRADLATQRQTDLQLPPDALAVRWQGLLGKGLIQSQSQGLLADLSAAHETVSQLEELPVLVQEKEKIQAVSDSKDETIKSAHTLIASTSAELATCKVITGDTDKLCKGKIDEYKATQRKRNILYSVAAFVGGVVLGRRF